MSEWRNICKDRDERPEVQEYKNWKELPPIPISFPANAALTGAWRTLRPILNYELCTKCGNCWLYCPEGTIKHAEDGSYVIDLDYCKGCGVCAKECPVSPVKAMTMIPEGEAQKEDAK